MGYGYLGICIGYKGVVCVIRLCMVDCDVVYGIWRLGLFRKKLTLSIM